jgi:hypothetical protein
MRYIFYIAKNKMNIAFTTHFSIVVQIITCIAGLHGLFIELPEKHKILHNILIIETFVQFIEIFFYVLFLRTMIQTSLSDMAKIRYYDWFITTPTMLFSTIAFFKYKQNLLEQHETPLTLKQFISENYKNILTIFVLNFLMLLFGYLGETAVIDNYVAVFIGFVFFALMFYIIYEDYAIPSQEFTMFYLTTFVWAIYGFVALLDPTMKNNTLNILDLIAKNFFGIYIYYVIKSL